LAVCACADHATLSTNTSTKIANAIVLMVFGCIDSLLPLVRRLYCSSYACSNLVGFELCHSIFLWFRASPLDYFPGFQIEFHRFSVPTDVPRKFALQILANPRE